MPESARVPVVAVTLRQVVVPARRSQFMARTVDIVNTPPPVVAPAAVFEAVVSVARAFAVPLFPDVPVPVARKIVPVVPEVAPMLVQFCPPTSMISYHWPETKEPAETVGLFAPPMFTSTSRVILKPFA